jgi:two-component system chemotaxis response regulator CheB
VKRLRVVIADDSSIFREVLADALQSERDIEVVGAARDGDEAVRLAATLMPDLVTVDIQMPRLGGLAAIEQIMSHRPVPILVLTSQPTGPESDLVYQAVQRGALEILEKKVVAGVGGASALRANVRRLAQVRVVRHVASHPRPVPVATEPLPELADLARRRRVIAIGASAGGPAAVSWLLGQLPKDLPACIALVQHIPVGFVESFARFLASETKLNVSVIKGRTAPEPGRVLLAMDDRHLVATPQGDFAPAETPPIRGYRPAVTALFSSVAMAFGDDAVGVILTGMGDDGAAGAQELHQRKALVIAQDEQSSVVYGMPKAVVDLGAAHHVLPLENIPGALMVATGYRIPLGKRQ